MTRDRCAGYEPMLARAADGSLDEDGRVRLTAHLEGCASCRAALEVQIAMRQALAAIPVAGASPGFAARTLARIDAARRRPAWIELWDFRRWTWRLAPVAGALALCAYLVTGPVSTTPDDAFAAAEPLPVSAALWSDGVSETDVLSLLLLAGADDSLAGSLDGRLQ